MCISTKRRNAFTLFEVVVALAIISVAMAAATMLFTALVKTEDALSSKSYADIFLLEDDMVYSSSLAKSISYSDGTLTIARYDGCTISYQYDRNKKEIKKSAACPDGYHERAMRVGEVVKFDVQNRGSGLYVVTISKNPNGKFDHSLVLRVLQ